MKDLKISVIVPIYNVEKYLIKCVQSVCSQTYKNLEIILVDDGSPDGCAKICDDFAKQDKRVKVLHIENGGVSNARNKGVEVSTGDFVAFVDGDDFIEPTMMEKLIEKQQETNSDLTFCKYNCVSEADGKVTKMNEVALEDFCKTNNVQYIFNHSTESGDSERIIEQYVFASVWRILYRADVIKNNNIKFATSVKSMEDTLFLFSVLKQPNLKLAYVDDFLYDYLIRTQVANNRRNIAFSENLKNFVKELEILANGTQYEVFCNALKFFCYSECFMFNLSNPKAINLKELKSWNTCKNYSAHKKLCTNFKQKIIYFLVRNNLSIVFKIKNKI